jgi:hypothetical protein
MSDVIAMSRNDFDQTVDLLVALAGRTEDKKTEEVIAAFVERLLNTYDPRGEDEV